MLGGLDVFFVRYSNYIIGGYLKFTSKFAIMSLLYKVRGSNRVYMTKKKGNKGKGKGSQAVTDQEAQGGKNAAGQTV